MNLQTNQAGNRLQGKVALVTGGTSGIGLATAELFADEGAQVIVASRRVSSSFQIESDAGQIRWLKADVARPDDVEHLLQTIDDEYGRLDVLLSNAGSHEPGTAWDMDVDGWHRVIDTNLSAHFFLAKWGVPLIAKSGGGSLILTSSEFGLVGSRHAVAYCAAKGGIINMTRALAVDCGTLKVRVNCLAPGPVATPNLLRHFADDGDPVGREKAQTQPVLLGRLGQVDEIARASLFLASEESSFMTGATLVVDGGITAWYGL